MCSKQHFLLMMCVCALRAYHIYYQLGDKSLFFHQVAGYCNDNMNKC